MHSKKDVENLAEIAQYALSVIFEHTGGEIQAKAGDAMCTIHELIIINRGD